MTRLVRAAWLLLLLGCARAPGPAVLLTGFEPFGGRPANASWDAVAPLDGTRHAGAVLHCVRLPVEWGSTEALLREALDRWKPAAVVCLGEGRPGLFSVEAVAENRVGNWPDNRGRAPGREVVVPGAPATVPSGLPVDRIAERLAREGFAVERSADAGRYLCGECFYTLMHLSRERREAGPRGFLHVPPHPDGAPPAVREAHAAEVRRAVLCAVEEVLGRR